MPFDAASSYCVRYTLVVAMAADGWRTWELKPIPGAEELRALVPTPQGVLTVGE